MQCDEPELRHATFVSAETAQTGRGCDVRGDEHSTCSILPCRQQRPCSKKSTPKKNRKVQRTASLTTQNEDLFENGYRANALGVVVCQAESHKKVLQDFENELINQRLLFAKHPIQLFHRESKT